MQGAPTQEPTEDELSLQVLLDEPIFTGATMHCANRSSSDIPVCWALPLRPSLEEATDLRGVLVHTGNIWPEPADIRRLGQSHAAALVVNTTPTADFVTEANSHDLAILVCNLSFYQLNRTVAQKSLAQQAHVLEYGVGVNRALTEVLYRGAGLSAMCRQLSKLSRSAVFLLDAQLEVLGYESLSPMAVADPSEVLRLLRLAISDGKLSPDPAGPDRVTTLTTLTLEQTPVVCVVCPIALGGTTYGWGIIVEFTHPPLRHDVAQHRAILEHGMSIIGAEILRLRSVSEAEERARGDFVHALLHGRFKDNHELTTRSTFHDFDIKGTYGVLVVDGALAPHTKVGLERQGSIARWLREYANQGNIRTFATTVGDLVVVVREIAQLAPGTSTDPDDNALADFARDLDRDLRARTGAKLAVAYGRPGFGAAGVAASYREARISIRLAEELSLGRITSYADLRVYAILSEVAAAQSGQEFSREILGPLRNGTSGEDLEHVVLAYVSSGGNLNAAARNLNMHRNTVLYKLSRASRLLGFDVRQAEYQFTLWLASRLDLLSRVERSVVDDLGIAPNQAP